MKIHSLIITINILFQTLVTYANSNYNNKVSDSIKNLIQVSKFEEVIQLTNQLKENKIATSEIYFFEGISYKNLYKINEAIDAFKNSYQTDSTNYHNLTEIANCYKNLGDFKNALEYYEKASKLLPTNKTIKTEIANMNFAMENFIQAKNQFLQIYATDTSNVFIIKNLAKCYDNLEKNDSAIIYFNKALSLNPTDNQTIFRLSNIYIKLKAYNVALKITEDYIKNDSLNSKINSINAYIYVLKNDFKNSYSKFLYCYRNNDTSKFVLKYLGISAFKIDSLENAKIFLEKAFAKDTTDYQTSNFLGITCATYIYKQLGIYYLNKTIKLLTADSIYLSKVYFNLGKAYGAWSSNISCENGLNAYIRAYELNSKDTIALLFMAFGYDNCLKDKEMAIKYYRQFIATKPLPNENKNSNKRESMSYYDTAIKRLDELEKNINNMRDNTIKKE